MSNELQPKQTPNQAIVYQIRLKGHLGREWTDWFEGLTITLEENGDTLITGPVTDQAALHGLLKKVRDLGMHLVSVVPMQSNESQSSRSKRRKMNTTRKIAMMTGVVFIIATVTGLVAAALIPDLTDTGYLARFFENKNQVVTGALLYLIGYLACAGIGVVMYPVLKQLNTGLALGSVIFRALEAAFYLVGLVCLLSLPALGQQFISSGSANRPLLEVIGGSLVSVHDYAGLVGVFAFCLGALMYYYLFFATRLIPRWLSGFGIIAIILMLTACVLALFSGNRITSYIPLAFPIFIQEMVLAVWLIVKGFNQAAIASLPATTEPDELSSAVSLTHVV